MVAAVAQLPSEERLARLFQHLGVARAHVAAGWPTQAVGLVSAYPELVSSLTLVCPTRFDAELLAPLGQRILFVHGDHGPNALNVPRAVSAPTVLQSLVDYMDALWSDAVADRYVEIGRALLDFLAEVSTASPSPRQRYLQATVSSGHQPSRARQWAAARALPLNLAGLSGISRAAPGRAYCTIGCGPSLGFVPYLEQRMRGGYGTVVRSLVDAADEAV
jgi:hypothetical protein